MGSDRAGPPAGANLGRPSTTQYTDVSMSADEQNVMRSLRDGRDMLVVFQEHDSAFGNFLSDFSVRIKINGKLPAYRMVDDSQRIHCAKHAKGGLVDVVLRHRTGL